MKKILITGLVFFLLALNSPGSTEKDFALRRQSMVEQQIVARGIVDKNLLTAFKKVRRHLFLNPGTRDKAYLDTELPIDEGQTINRPYIVAIMTAIIAPTPQKKVLEIGTGSGYQAAILAELSKEVYTIDINRKLARKAEKTIRSLGYTNIKVKFGDGYLGWQEHAPYDGIIVTCSPDHIPPPLIEQLAVDGRMVIPVSFSSKVQELILIEKDEKGKLRRTNFIPVQFVPLIRRNNAQ